ncbi:MAG: hypothetical protein H0X13_05865 [Ramlibacter sp.]|nr:hypothetical protein [Ramlibacter sp.]
MKNLGLLLAVLLNGPFLILACIAAADRELEAAPRITAGLVTLALAAALVLLLLVRVRRLPANGSRLMAYLCLAVPLLWLAGSMDRGIISGQEWAFLIVVCLVTVGTWYVFRLLRKPA